MKGFESHKMKRHSGQGGVSSGGKAAPLREPEKVSVSQKSKRSPREQQHTVKQLPGKRGRR